MKTRTYKIVVKLTGKETAEEINKIAEAKELLNKTVDESNRKQKEKKKG